MQQKASNTKTIVYRCVTQRCVLSQPREEVVNVADAQRTRRRLKFAPEAPHPDRFMCSGLLRNIARARDSGEGDVVEGDIGEALARRRCVRRETINALSLLRFVAVCAFCTAARR